MKKAKFAIFFSILLVLGIVLTSLWLNIKKRDGSDEEKLPNISTGGAEMRLEKIRLSEDKDGRKTWELEAKSINQYQERNTILLEEVRVTYYTRDGRVILISGDRGEVNQDSKDMRLMGNVILSLSDGYSLKTNSISYQHLSKKVITHDPVEMEGKQIRMKGKGMWIDMEAKKFKILDEVKTKWMGGKG